MRGKKWTNERLDELRRDYRVLGAPQLAVRFGLSAAAVRAMAHRVGVSIDNETFLAEKRQVREAAAAQAAERRTAKLLSAQGTQKPDVPPPEETTSKYACCWPILSHSAGQDFCRAPVRVRDGRIAPYCPKHCKPARMELSVVGPS